MNSTAPTRGYTRREFGRLALGGVPAAALGIAAFPNVLDAAAINSRIRGVQIGAITYSFRALTGHAIVGHGVDRPSGRVDPTMRGSGGAPGGPDAPLPRALAAARAPAMGAGPADPRTPASTSGPFANMNVKTVGAISAWAGHGDAPRRQGDVHVTQVSMAKRVAPLADRHQNPAPPITATPTCSSWMGCPRQRSPPSFQDPAYHDRPGYRHFTAAGRCSQKTSANSTPDHAPSP
jgi:hypothetical protein